MMNKFQKDIQKALEFYPFLQIDDSSQFVRVVGEIILEDPDLGEFDRYSVSISVLKCYPYCFPKVIVLGDKIPKVDYRHVNPDGSLCLAVPPEERLVAKNGITFKFFLDKVLVPHLSRETYREKSGNYPDGEYEHGNAGIWQFYFQKLRKIDKTMVISELRKIRNPKWPNRNERCSCGSGKKFKQCHLETWQEIKSLGDFYLDNQIETLKTDLQNG
jgi:hypothetical protein